MKSLPASREDQKNAALRRRSFYWRVALALLLVPGITAYCVWMIQTAAHRAFNQSTPGRIVRLYDHVAPQVEQRDKDIEELTRP